MIYILNIQTPKRDFPICKQYRHKLYHTRLQARAVHDLDVNDELTGTIVGNKDADGATARLEVLSQALPEVGLLHDGNARAWKTGCQLLMPGE